MPEVKDDEIELRLPGVVEPEVIDSVLVELAFEKLMNLRAAVRVLGHTANSPRFANLARGLQSCRAVLGRGDFEIFRMWLGFGEVSLGVFDMRDFVRKLTDLDGKIDSLVERKRLENRLLQATGRQGLAVGLDTGDPDRAMSPDRGVFEKFMRSLHGGEEMQIPHLKMEDFPDSKDGDILFEGKVCFTTMGSRPGLECDCEYVRTDDGREFFDGDLFRGIQGRVRVKKIEGEFKVEKIGGRS